MNQANARALTTLTPAIAALTGSDRIARSDSPKCDSRMKTTVAMESATMTSAMR